MGSGSKPELKNIPKKPPLKKGFLSKRNKTFERRIYLR